MTKIYIAGPMTGLPDLNYPAFHEAAAALRAAGHEVFNPAENPAPACGSWNGYMRMAIAQLTQCEAIYLLPNWMRSKGARLECRIAMDFGLQRMYSQIEVDQLARMNAAIEDAKTKGARVAMVDGGPVFFSCEGDQQAKGIEAAIAEYIGAADCPACGGSGHVEDVQAEPVMIYHGRCTIDCGAHGHHDVEMLKMIPAGAKLYTAPQAQPAEAPIAYLQEADQHLLHRFIETTEDDESFDIGKDAVKRLANLGVVENCGFGRYGVTMFGYWVHEHFWHQNPSLPLKTNADRDLERRAAMAAAQEGGAA